MPITKVQAPDGSIIKVEHPEGASQDSIIGFAKSNFKPSDAPVEEESGLTVAKGINPAQVVKKGAADMIRNFTESIAGDVQVAGMVGTEKAAPVIATIATTPTLGQLQAGYIPVSKIKEDVKLREFVMSPEGQASMDEALLDTASAMRDLSSDMYDNFGVNPDYAQSAAGKAQGVIVELGQQIFVGALGTYLGGKPGQKFASYSYNFGRSVTATVRDAENTYGKKYKDFTPEQKKQTAIAVGVTGVAEALLESIGLESTPAVRRLINGNVKEKLGGKVIVNSIKKAIAGGALGEAGTELAQEVVRQITASQTFDEGRELLSREQLFNYIEVVALGGFGGGTMGGGVTTLQRAAQGTLTQKGRERVSEVIELSEKIAEEKGPDARTYRVTYLDEDSNREETISVAAGSEQEAMDMAQESFDSESVIPGKRMVVKSAIPYQQTDEQVIEEPEVQPEVQPEAQPEVQPEVQPETTPQPEAQPEVQPETAPEATMQGIVPKDETRGKGIQYHGTSSEIESLNAPDDNFGDLNIYGQGFYTTEAVDIAKGYSKKGKGKTPSIYSVEEINPVEFMDIDDFKFKDLNMELSGEYQDVINDLPDNSTVRQVMDAMKSDIDETALEIQEMAFFPINDRIKELGYGGIQHIGGRNFNKKPHKVKIYFDPSSQIKINKLKEAPAPATPTEQPIPVSITDPDLITYIEFLQQEDPQGGDIIAGASTPAVPFTNEQVLREAKFKKNDPRIIKKLGNEPLPRGGVRLNLNSAFTLPNGQRGMLQTVHPMSSTGKVNYNEAHSYGSAYIIKDGKLSVSPLRRAIIGYGLDSKRPMASVDGDIVGTEPNLEANEILTFNPFRNSSFVDSRGRPVESFKGEGTVHGSKVYVRGTLNYAQQEPVRFTQKDMLDYLSGKTVKGKKLSFSELGIKGKDFPTDSDKAKEIRRMKKVVKERGELPFDSIQEDIVAGASTSTVGAARLTADAIINASDQVIDAPISIETDPGEGGKVRSIGKMYLLPESEVLDFKDNNNIAPAAKRISKVLDLAFKQFPKFSKWYSSRLEMAMNILQQLDSDLKKPQDQFIVKVLLAVTSNGNEVSPQTEESYRIYQYWKENNSIAVPSTQGTRKGALLNHLKLVDDIIKKHGWKKLKTFMDKSGTVKDLRKEMQNTFGYTAKEAADLTGGELVSEVVPFSIMLGPKLGSFYNNLNGNFDTTTMDRWFMRTFGRTLGQQFLRQDNTKQTKRFLDATNSILSDPEYASILDQRILKTQETTVRDLLPEGDQVNSSDLKRLSIFFSKKKNREIDGVPINKSAPLLNNLRLATNGLFKVGDGLTMLEAPKGGNHRSFIRKVMEQSLSDFNKANNLNFTPAEAQALLWYYEKLIHDSHGSRQKDEAPDYGSAANTLHRKITGRDSTRYRASDAVRRRGDVQPSGAVVSPAQQPSPPTGRRPESVGSAQPTSEQNTGQTQVGADTDITVGGFLGDSVRNFLDVGLNPPVDNSMMTPQERRAEEATAPEGAERFSSQQELEQAIESEFGPIIKALGLPPIFSNVIMRLAAQYNVSRNYIEYNPSLLIGQSKEYVRAVMREELIHAVTHKVLMQQGSSWVKFFGQVGRDMNAKERRVVSDVYPNLKDDYEFGAEFYRMIIQQGAYGSITEQFSKGGPAMSRIQKLLKKIQSYMARLLKTVAGEKYEADAMIQQSAALLASVDPSARLTNQKVVEQSNERVQREEGTKDITAGTAANVPNPPSKFKKGKEAVTNILTFVDKTVINTISNLLGRIHPEIRVVYQKYFNEIETAKLDSIKRVAPFIAKYNRIKNKADKNKIKQLLMYSPLDGEPVNEQLIQERDRLLAKYGMTNDYTFGVITILKRLRENAMKQGIEIQMLAEFFPRRVKDYKGLKDSLGKPIRDDLTNYIKEINDKRIKAELNREEGEPHAEPPVQEGSPEEAILIENYMRNKLYVVRSVNLLDRTGKTVSRTMEYIEDENLQYYDDPGSALEYYITNLIVATKTKEYFGRRYFSPEDTLGRAGVQRPGKVGLVIQKLRNNNEIDDDKIRNLQDLNRKILNPAARENQFLGEMRQLSYITSLVEFSSTLSQLYDLALVMYRDGLINTVRGVAAGRDFELESFGYASNRISDEFVDETKYLRRMVQKGLKSTGFTDLDRIMKQTNMGSAFVAGRGKARQYIKGKRNRAINKFRVQVEASVGRDNADAAIAALAKGDRNNALVRSYVFAQLLRTQPMSKLQTAQLSAMSPNARFLYQMKSFMVTQLAFAREDILNDMFGEGRTVRQRSEASLDLVRLLGFLIMVGVPIDLLKDFLVGRLAYLGDYLVNGGFRLLGVNKYNLYKAREEGVANAVFNYAMPITIQQTLDLFETINQVAFEGKPVSESKLITFLPYSEVINRSFGFGIRARQKKERKEYIRRAKEGERPFVIPPGALREL